MMRASCRRVGLGLGASGLGLACRRLGLGLGASGLGLACRRSGLGLGASGLGLACRRLLTLTQALASCIAQSMVSAQSGLCSTVGYLARVRVRARATEP